MRAITEDQADTARVLELMSSFAGHGGQARHLYANAKQGAICGDERLPRFQSLRVPNAGFGTCEKCLAALEVTEARGLWVARPHTPALAKLSVRAREVEAVQGFFSWGQEQGLTLLEEGVPVVDVHPLVLAWLGISISSYENERANELRYRRALHEGRGLP
jgi:hypothetical protein